ncbi:MAG: hypothetical protein MUF54_21710, partial [Polyangiaceae bacterium]|nr:hypothetical protein [Polyangiaceae bacterium]
MVDRTKAAAWVAHATSDPRPRVDLVPLLPPVPQAAGYAFEARLQAEGAAALRYRVPRDAQGSPKGGAQMTRIEVAWDNAFEGPPRRGLIPAAGVVRDDDVSSARPDEAAVARSGILSVSVGGIFVCPHARCDGASTSLLFLDGKGGLRTVQVPAWQGAAGLNAELSSHMIRTGLGDVPIAFTGGLPVVLRARARDDTGYDYAALGLLPWDAEQRGWHERLTWAFGPPDALALAFTAWHEDGAAAFARILHLNVDKGVASTSPAPTQSDLPDPPVACPQTLRHSSMRIVGPAQPRTRHPVLVRFRDGSGLNLRTDQAVLHGTPEQPCAAVLDAAGASGPYRALIPLDDLEHAWLFEKIGADQLGWKTMTCRFEAGASLDAPAPAPTPAIGPTGTGRRPATQQECDEIFTTMVRTALGGRTQPPATGPFDAMRTSFRDRCLGRPVDIDCVRRATLPEQVQRCIDLASK